MDFPMEGSRYVMKRYKGFTLIELVVTIAIAAIVLTIGVPSFQSVILNNRLITQTNDLVTSLNLARSEAVKNGVRTVICQSSDGTSCTGDKAGWGKGWIVFSDLNTDDSFNGTGECKANEECLIQHRGELEGKNGLVMGDAIIRFNAKGLTVGLGNGSFKLCDVRGKDYARKVVIARTGRARVEAKGDSCT